MPRGGGLSHVLPPQTEYRQQLTDRRNTSWCSCTVHTYYRSTGHRLVSFHHPPIGHSALATNSSSVHHSHARNSVEDCNATVAVVVDPLTGDFVIRTASGATGSVGSAQTTILARRGGRYRRDSQRCTVRAAAAMAIGEGTDACFVAANGRIPTAVGANLGGAVRDIATCCPVSGEHCLFAERKAFAAASEKIPRTNAQKQNATEQPHKKSLVHATPPLKERR